MAALLAVCPLQKLDLMARFRPNVVVRGGAAFEEDQWSTLTMPQAQTTGGSLLATTTPPLMLRAYKPCNRCGVINVDTVRDHVITHECVRASPAQTSSPAMHWCIGCSCSCFPIGWRHGRHRTLTYRCRLWTACRQGTAERHREPFLTLAQYRRDQGKVLFGSLYSLAGEAAAAMAAPVLGTSTHRYTIEVGAELLVTSSVESLHGSSHS
jgi:uncharacterized protein YcbX